MTAPNQHQPSQGGPPNDGAPHPADADRQSTAVAQVAAASTGISKTNETTASMLASRARAEIQVRTEQALRFPRDSQVFRERILKACDSIVFADQAMYEKPVGGGKTASGLSIRFAEEAARYYGNLDISVVIISEDDERRVIEGVSVDLETNHVERLQMVIPKYVERAAPRAGDEIIGERMNSRNVKTYKIRATDDALFTITQAASAKARREAILMQIPFWIKEEAEERINKTLETFGGDPAKFVEKLLKDFERLGVVKAQIERLLEKTLGKTLASLNAAELKRLKKIQVAIQQGEATWKDVVENANVTDEKPADGATAAAGTPAPDSKSAAAGLRKKTTASAAKTDDSAAASTLANGQTVSVIDGPVTPVSPSPKPTGTPCEACGRTDGTHPADCPYAD